MMRLPSTIPIKWKEKNSDDSEEGSDNNEVFRQRDPLEIPVWNIVQESIDHQKYRLPKSYITFEGEYDIPEYELDEEDESFIQRQLKSRHHTFNLNEDVLERIIDFLEKESYVAREYSKVVRLKEKNKIACCVCSMKDRRNPDGTISNSVMGQCLGCKIISHATCQGRETLDNWTCARCASATQRGDGKKSNNKESQEKCFAAYKNIKCEICRESEGSMIQKPDGDWVHNTCILWIPGYEFPLPASQEIKRKKRHYPYKCSVCQEPENVIRCSINLCSQYYHGHCAQKSDFYMNCNYPDGYPISYCQQHSDAIKKQITEVFLAKSLSTIDVGGFITDETHKLFEARHQVTIPANVFKCICDYWKKKRLAIDYGRKPLIPRLADELRRPKMLEHEAREKKALLARSRWENIKNSLTEQEKEIDVLQDMPQETSFVVETETLPLVDTSRSILARNYFIEGQLAQIETNFRITRRRLKETIGYEESGIKEFKNSRIECEEHKKKRPCLEPAVESDSSSIDIC